MLSIGSYQKGTLPNYRAIQILYYETQTPEEFALLCCDNPETLPRYVNPLLNLGYVSDKSGLRSKLCLFLFPSDSENGFLLSFKPRGHSTDSVVFNFNPKTQREITNLNFI